MFTEFETSRLIVRKIRIDDVDVMFEKWTQSEAIAKYMVWKAHTSRDETEQFVRLCLEEWDSNSYTWIVELKDTNEIIGSFAARQIGYKVDIGYLIAKDHWGNGYMPEVTTAFINKALVLDSVERIWAICDIDNLASKRVMEKSGMSYEGILRSFSIHPNISDRPRDCHCLSIVKP